MKIKTLKNFIVFEGLDGAGTTTQAKLLNDKVKNSIFTCEPTDNEIGKFIRRILRSEASCDPLTLAYLFSADRSEHIVGKNGVIEQSKEKKVICDRYLFSSFAYQCLNVDFDKVLSLNGDFILPEVLFFIDTPIEECQKRIKKRDNNEEIFENISLQQKILDNYNQSLDFYEKQGFKYYRLDGTKKIDELLKEEMSILGGYYDV